MASPHIVVPQQRGANREIIPLMAPSASWEVLGWIGMTFFLIGVIDIALAWFPPVLGSPEWEFGTITATLNTVPLPTLGILLFLAAALATQARARTRVACITSVIAAIMLLAIATLYATVAPAAFRGVDNEVVATGLTKAVVKAGSLLIIMPAVLLWAAARGWRAAGGR